MEGGRLGAVVTIYTQVLYIYIDRCVLTDVTDVMTAVRTFTGNL